MYGTCDVIPLCHFSCGNELQDFITLSQSHSPPPLRHYPLWGEEHPPVQEKAHHFQSFLSAKALCNSQINFHNDCNSFWNCACKKYLGWASWCWHLVKSPCHLRSSWGPFALRPPPTTSSQGVLRTERVIKSQIVWILHDFGVSQNVDLWIAASITITSKLIKFDVTCISTCERLQPRHLELWQFCPGSLHQLHCGVAWDMQLLMVSIQLCHQFVLNL